MRAVSDSTIADSAALLITIPLPPITRGIVVTGFGGQVMRNVLPTDVWFEVTNRGNTTESFWFRQSCTNVSSPGPINTATCKVLGTGATPNDSATQSLAPGAQTQLRVTLNPQVSANNGKVTLVGWSALDGAYRDSVSMSFIQCCATISAWHSVTPDYIATVHPTNTVVRDSFLVRNRGSGNASLWMVSGCDSHIAASTCTIEDAAGNPISTLTLLSLGTATVYVRYTTPAVAGKAVMILQVSNSAYTGQGTAEFAWRNVVVTPNTAPAVAISPRALRRSRPVSTAGLVDTFVVSNAGAVTDSFSLALSCARPPIVSAACTMTTPASVTLGPRTAIAVPVTYSTGATPASGALSLIATSRSLTTVADTGVLTITTTSGSTVALTVTPDRAPRTRTINAVGIQDTFVVANTGTQDLTVSLSAACMGAGAVNGCTLVGTSPRSVTRGSAIPVAVQYNTTSLAGTGRVALAATAGAAADSGDVVVTTIVPVAVGVAVLPDSARRPRRTSQTGLVDTLIVRNTGTASHTYSLSLSCSTPVISCSSVPATSLTLAAGQSAPVVVTYGTDATVGTSTLALTATSSTTSSIADRGTILVTTSSPPTVALNITPSSVVQPRPTNAIGVTNTFTVTNLGSNPDQVALSLTCAASVIVPGCAFSGPATVALAAGGSVPITVTYSTTASAGSGTLQLTATSQTDPTVSITGTATITTTAPTLGRVAASPKGGQQLGGALSSVTQVPFTIRNLGVSSGSFGLSFRCYGAAIQTGTCALVGTTPVTLAPNDSALRNVQFTSSAVSGATGRVTLLATLLSDSTVLDSGYVDVSTVTAATALAVTPKDSIAANFTAGSLSSVTFRIANTSAGPGKFLWSSWCTPTNLCAPASDTTTTLAANASVTVARSFTLPSPGDSGRTWLTASLVNNGTVADTGWVNVFATGRPSVAIALASVNPGPNIARNQCLRVALGEQAASECGDLRLTHPLPLVRSLGTTRVPTLVYSSAHAHPFPVVAVELTRLPHVTAIDSVVMQLYVRNVLKRTATFSGTMLTQKGVARVHLAYDAATDTTGRYDYTVRATTWRTGGGSDVATANSQLVVVNRKTSKMGPGWWVAGVERIVKLTSVGSIDTLLWIGGDGSTRVYTRPNSGVPYAALSLSRPDSLKVVGSTYERALPGGTKVRFQATTGLHTETVNRLGHRTLFRYDTVAGVARLRFLKLPPDTLTLAYQLKYNATSGWLDSVLVPAGVGTQQRHVALGHDATTGRITTITDPGVTSIAFDYDLVQVERVNARRNRLSRWHYFAYDSAWQVRRDSAPVGATFARVTIRNAATLGLSFATTPQASMVDTALVYTRIDGPRLDVADTTGYWHDAYGAVRKIRNARGDSTLIRHDELRFPNVVTSVVQPNGRTLVSYFDARANTDSVIDRGRCDPTGCATTRYQWDARWDAPTRITRPLGAFVALQYDTANGNLLSRADGRPNSATQYRYWPAGIGTSASLLQAVIAPNGATDSLSYDAALGNPYRVRSPLGFTSYTMTDAVGRDTLSVVPVDSADTTGAPYSSMLALTRRRQRTVYDARDRITSTVGMGPARSYPITAEFNVAFSSVAESLRVRTEFDDEDNILKTWRIASPAPTGVDSLETRWTYDELNRVVRERAHGGATDSTTYDEAGNRRSYRSRLGETVAFTYDNLNRLSTKAIPSVTRASWTDGSYWTGSLQFPLKAPAGLTLGAESAQFQYDAVGNLIRADNDWAQIGRTYDLDGRLATDTVHIRAYATVDFGRHIFTIQHRYDLEGREVQLVHPVGLAPRVNGDARDTTWYDYYPETGLLRSVREPTQRETYGFTYDLQDRLIGRTGPSGFTATQTYDLGDRLTNRLEVVGATTVHSDTLSYHADGTVARVGGTTELVRDAYSGLGTLIGQSKISRPNSLVRTDERYTTDAMANVLQKGVSGNTGSSIISEDVAQTYDAAARLTASHDVVQSARAMAQTYDSAGNVITSVRGEPGSREWLYNAYDAEGHLRVVDRRSCGMSSGLPNCNTVSSGFMRGAYEEYRYDALGRRVLLRSWRDLCNQGGGYCLAAIQRSVWDRDQLLYEIRYRGDDFMTPDSLERDTTTLISRRLTPCILNPNCVPNVSDTAASFAQLFGRTMYVHGPGLDTPLRIERVGFFSGSSVSIGVTPLRTWRGQVDTALNVLPNMRFAGRTTEASLLDRNFETVPIWAGSLLDEQRDATGLLYRRNRYYDPKTGRFTQEDPIGLAGGANLYGFANGDPVNYGDPFGLCRDGSTEKACTSRDAAARLAIHRVNPRSIRENREYGGEIVQRGQGRFYYIPARPGTEEESSANRFVIGFEGSYHTHGADSRGLYRDEEFSEKDKGFGDTSEKPSYLGTPSGRILRYDPDAAKKKRGPVTDITRP